MVDDHPPPSFGVRVQVDGRDARLRQLLLLDGAARADRLQDVLVEHHPGQVAGHLDSLLGEEELDVRGVPEDGVPGSGHLRPSVQRRPPRVGDGRPVGPLPHLGHGVEVAGLERGVVRRVHGRDGVVLVSHEVIVARHARRPCRPPPPRPSPATASRSPYTGGAAATAHRCCSPTRRASTESRGSPWPGAWLHADTGSGRSTSVATATVHARRTGTTGTDSRKTSAQSLAISGSTTTPRCSRRDTRREAGPCPSTGPTSPEPPRGSGATSRSCSPSTSRSHPTTRTR